MNCTEPKPLVATKRHQCTWCDTPIQPKDPYWRWRCYDGPDANTVKLHDDCFSAMNSQPLEEKEDGVFYPGDNPRAGNCGWCGDCEKCEAHRRYHAAIVNAYDAADGHSHKAP